MCKTPHERLKWLFHEYRKKGMRFFRLNIIRYKPDKSDIDLFKDTDVLDTVWSYWKGHCIVL